MNTEADFIRAIVADPDDDTRRLAFADWLQENDQERRAEFIRRQIELAHDPKGRAVVPLHAPKTREFIRPMTLNLLARVRPWDVERADQFVSPMVAVLSDDQSSVARCVCWHRGFPTIIGCTQRSWHEHYRLFPGPIEAVCQIRSSGCVWGVVVPRESDGSQTCVALNSRGLRVVQNRGQRWDAAYKEAFPNVRMFLGPCSPMLLHQFCDRGLRGTHWERHRESELARVG